MNDLGSLVQGGFQPGNGAVSLDDIMARVGGEAQNIEQSESAKKEEELLQKYLAFSKSPAGRAVLEDLLNMTFRSSNAPVDGIETKDAYLFAAVKHQAKCDLVATIAAKIIKGKELAKAQQKAKKAKK